VPREESALLIAELRSNPPDGMKVTRAYSWHPWCSDAWRWQSDKNFALYHLMKGDPCCAECGMDLKALEKRAEIIHREYRRCVTWADYRAGFLVPVRFRERWGWQARERALRSMGFTHPRQSFAELDHIVPLWEGGSKLRGNLQVLCQPCHREKTKHESKRRARAKKLAGL
jgi:hypothetical protein